MTRTYTNFAETDPVARSLVDELPTLSGEEDVASYRSTMRELGKLLARNIAPKLHAQPVKDVCVICTVEDADFLARGLIEGLEAAHLPSRIRLVCMWNQRVKREGVSISPVLRTYEEPFDKEDSVFILVKSIVSGACVVKTNLTKAITSANPKRVFVAAPVIRDGAEGRLAREFPLDVSRRFEFVHFATDTELSPDGEALIPGVGGSVYKLLGLGTAEEKNRYVPEIVRERRTKASDNLQHA